MFTKFSQVKVTRPTTSFSRSIAGKVGTVIATSPKCVFIETSSHYWGKPAETTLYPIRGWVPAECVTEI